MSRPTPGHVRLGSAGGAVEADRSLTVAAAAFAVSTAFGSAVSVRHNLPGRPLGVSLPLSVSRAVLIGWGAGVAAPWPMPVTALLAAASTRRRLDSPKQPGSPAGLVCLSLGLGCIVGTLVEPVTYQRPATPAVRAAVLANTAAALLLAAAGRRASVSGRLRK